MSCRRSAAQSDRRARLGSAIPGARRASGAGVAWGEFRGPPRLAGVGEYGALLELPYSQRLPRVPPAVCRQCAGLPRCRLPGAPSRGGLRARDVLHGLSQRAELLRRMSRAIGTRREPRLANGVSRRQAVLRFGAWRRGTAESRIVRQLSCPARLPAMSLGARRQAVQPARARLRRRAAEAEELLDVHRVPWHRGALTVNPF